MIIVCAAQVPAVMTPSRPANEHRSTAATKSRKNEMSSPTVTVTTLSHVGRDSKLSTCPKVMFTGVVADNSEKVGIEILLYQTLYKYHRCIKSFFGYDRLYSVTAFLLDLQLPSFDTVLYNYKSSFSMQLTCSGNAVVKYLFSIGM